MAHFAARHFGIFLVAGGLAPYSQQEPLTQSLELPLPDGVTKTLGIHQSDVIIRSALTVALADLRANPWLMDYAFASLPQDPLTWKEYGEKSVQQAKQWLTNTQIPVKVAPVLNEIGVPSITVSLVDSAEATNESSIGDVHSEAFETTQTPWRPLTAPFTPASYSPGTGIMVLSSLPDDVYLGVGMYIIDKTGRPHEIIEVLDGLTLGIQPGTVADFRDATLKSARPGFVTSIESSSYRETYRIGIHVGGEPALLTWLHSAVVFCLLRYKEALLEARGFERSTMQSSDQAREQQFDSELVFSRYITVSGYVRQYWPKVVAAPIDAVVMDPIRVSGVAGGPSDVDLGTTPGPSVKVADAGVDPNEQLWVGDLDTLDPKKRK